MSFEVIVPTCHGVDVVGQTLVVVGPLTQSLTAPGLLVEQAQGLLHRRHRLGVVLIGVVVNAISIMILKEREHVSKKMFCR